MAKRKPKKEVKPNNQSQSRIRDVAYRLAFGATPAEIMEEYGGQWNVGKDTFNKYMRLARPLVDQIRIKANEHVENVVSKELAEKAAPMLKTLFDKREILGRIMDGELLCDKVMIIGREVKKVKAAPDHQDIMRAIELDSKLAGDFAPIKTAQTDSEGRDVAHQLDYARLTTEELVILRKITVKAQLTDGNTTPDH